MAERIIESSGRYNLSQIERSSRRIRVFGGVLRQPQNQSVNFRYNKFQTFYGYAQLCSGDLVLETKQLQYDGELLFDIETDIDNRLKILQYCETLAVLNRSAQEWTQYAALPFTLVSAALILFFQNQALSLDPPILQYIVADSIRVKLYNDTVYKVVVKTEPFDTCSAASNAVFQEPDVPNSANDFPDSPNPPQASPPYSPFDPDTPGGNPGNGLGNSGIQPGQVIGVPGNTYRLSWTVDLPGGGCSSLPPGTGFPANTVCADFPVSGTLDIVGEWIAQDLTRNRCDNASDPLLRLSIGVFQILTQTEVETQITATSGGCATPSIADGMNWIVDNAQITSYSFVQL